MLIIIIYLLVGNDKVSLKGLKTVDVTASFRNPLNKPLTNVVYYIEGTGLLAATHVKSKYNFYICYCCCCYCYCSYSNIAAKGTSTVSFKVTPRSYSHARTTRNKVTLIVTAKSKQLKGLMGTASINIVP